MAMGGLPPQERKLYLDAVCNEELQRIARQRLITRMDAVVCDDEIDRSHDLATAEALKTIATRGLNVQLTSADIGKLQAAGATDADVYTLLDAINMHVMALNSPAGTAKMLRCAKNVLDDHLGAEHSLKGSPSALAVFMLRQLVSSAKAAAWQAADAPDGNRLEAVFATPMVVAHADNNPAPPVIPNPASATVSSASPNVAGSSKFTTDPNMMSDLERLQEPQTTPPAWPYGIRDGQFWGPLLGVYTEARREELLGLSPGDIITVDGFAFIDLRINDNRGLKNAAAVRIIPIHSTLDRLRSIPAVCLNCWKPDKQVAQTGCVRFSQAQNSAEHLPLAPGRHDWPLLAAPKVSLNLIVFKKATMAKRWS